MYLALLDRIYYALYFPFSHTIGEEDYKCRLKDEGLSIAKQGLGLGQYSEMADAVEGGLYGAGWVGVEGGGDGLELNGMRGTW